jgi:hypothetical protein
MAYYVTAARQAQIDADPDLIQKNGRIGYDQVSGTATASTEAAGWPAEGANNSLTYSGWKPTATTGTWTLTFGAATTIGFIGIAGHDLGTQNATIDIKQGATVLETVTPTDNSAILLEIVPVSTSSIEIEITASDAAPTIRVIQAGTLLVVEQQIYGGHAPIDLSRKTVTTTNISENGQTLGRSIIRGGTETSYQFDHLDPTWYYANFDPFMLYARTKPFFISWRPIEFSSTEYGWFPDGFNPAPSFMGVYNYIAVNINVRGLGYE